MARIAWRGTEVALVYPHFNVGVPSCSTARLKIPGVFLIKKVDKGGDEERRPCSVQLFIARVVSWPAVSHSLVQGNLPTTEQSRYKWLVVSYDITGYIWYHVVSNST